MMHLRGTIRQGEYHATIRGWHSARVTILTAAAVFIDKNLHVVHTALHIERRD